MNILENLDAAIARLVASCAQSENEWQRRWTLNAIRALQRKRRAIVRGIA